MKIDNYRTEYETVILDKIYIKEEELLNIFNRNSDIYTTIWTSVIEKNQNRRIITILFCINNPDEIYKVFFDCIDNKIKNFSGFNDVELI